jgi:hypothetical protein
MASGAPQRGKDLMKIIGLAAGVAFLGLTQAVAADARLERSLKMLAPSERLEQLCDYTAMARIRSDLREFRPDRAVANAEKQSRMRGQTLQAPGGAFRSRGKWYTLSFTCTATPDHMSVVSFQYKVGKEIPEAKWQGYGLWD